MQNKPKLTEHELARLHEEGFKFMGNDDSEDAHAPLMGMTYDELTASLPADVAAAFILSPGYIGADSVDLILYITENQIYVTPDNYRQVAQSFRQWYKEVAPDEYHEPPSYAEAFGEWGHGGWRPGAGYGPGRKPLPESERRVKTSVTISPDNMAWLNEQPTNRSETINNLIEAARAG